jgi:predicted RNA-binding Zn-ribbon protein involved in translation (DUF1610 family)
MTTIQFSNSDDVIDSRDIIERIKELERQLDTWTCPKCGNEITTEVQKEDQKGHADDCDFEGDPLDGLEYDEREELRALLDLQDDAEGYCDDWKYGASLIRDSYFRDYAEELANDIGAIDRNATWPLNHIDWDAAADELKQDYTEVDYDGVSYWVR